MLAPAPYPTARPAGACAATGTAIGPGDPYVAALRRDDDGSFARCDFTPRGWDEIGGVGFFAHWRATMPHKDQKPQPLGRRPADAAVLLDLVDRLEDDSDGLAFRFVLCLMLMRQRRLTFLDADGPTWTLRRVGGGELTVDDPGLDDAAVRRVTNEVETLLRDGAEVET